MIVGGTPPKGRVPGTLRGSIEIFKTPDLFHFALETLIPGDREKFGLVN